MDPMGTTNVLLQEILQEIREVKAHVIPAQTKLSTAPVGSGGQLISSPNFTKMLGSARSEERAQVGTLLGTMAPKKVISPGWVLKPYTNVFPQCDLEEVEDEEEAEVELASAGGVVVPTKKRLSKEEKWALSPEQKHALKEMKCAAAAVRKANRTPQEQAKIDDRVAKMKAAREAKKAGAGGERTRKRKIHRSRTRKA